MLTRFAILPTVSAIKKYLSRIGKRGGNAKSAEKAAASRANIAKANAALRKKRLEVLGNIVRQGPSPAE